MMNTRPALNLISNETLETVQNNSPSYHDISSALQTTLEFDKLISIFSHKIMGMVPHSAYAYINYEMGQSIRKGVFTKHTCSYALQFDKQQLGEFCLMRNERFEDVELQLLEVLLCCLIYPLKNATLYHKALKMAQAQPAQTILHVNERPPEVFGRAFSHGVNALVEHNRRLSDKKAVASSHKVREEIQNPWAVGFYR
jgi:hypothetical protein